MNQSAWILVDTETTGFAAAVFAVEIAARRMCGLKPDAGSCRKLLNRIIDNARAALQ